MIDLLIYVWKVLFKYTLAGPPFFMLSFHFTCLEESLFQSKSDMGDFDAGLNFCDVIRNSKFEDLSH